MPITENEARSTFNDCRSCFAMLPPAKQQMVMRMLDGVLSTQATV